MKLQLNKEWFEYRILPDEDFEVGAGVPTEVQECAEEASALSPSHKDTEKAAPLMAPPLGNNDRPT